MYVTEDRSKPQFFSCIKGQQPLLDCATEYANLLLDPLGVLF
jgi:hypothetical protein